MCVCTYIHTYQLCFSAASWYRWGCRQPKQYMPCSNWWLPCENGDRILLDHLCIKKSQKSGFFLSQFLNTDKLKMYVSSSKQNLSKGHMYPKASSYLPQLQTIKSIEVFLSRIILVSTCWKLGEAYLRLRDQLRGPWYKVQMMKIQYNIIIVRPERLKLLKMWWQQTMMKNES